MFTGIELLIYSDQFGLISICSIPILCRMFIFLFVLEEKMQANFAFSDTVKMFQGRILVLAICFRTCM